MPAARRKIYLQIPQWEHITDIKNTHNHVLQGTFGKPAVQKHRDEDVPQRRPEDLQEGEKRQ